MRSPASVPDGTISQQSFRIIVETKRSPNFSQVQLANHLSVFGTEDVKLLILLTPERCAVALPEALESGVHVVSLGFSDIVEACRSAGLFSNPALRDIAEDYEDYCHESNLISRESERMLVVPAGATLADNMQLRLYYAPRTRAFRKHSFIGLYARKSVRAVGEIENIVSGDFVSGAFVVQSNLNPVDANQLSRIREAIALAPNHGYDISSGHTFFLVQEFFLTDFKKSSSGGRFGKRYFDLREELGVPAGTAFPHAAEIAASLKQNSWD